MIDWQTKVVQLKATADELELWVAKTDGHVKLVMGRTADELRQLIREVEAALEPAPQAAHLSEQAPDWLIGSSFSQGDGQQNDAPVE